ncbi:hypothetical protein niasHT_030790 [Heterodera trifolii]|uniref:ribonuclease Z n=1 Tax=Heterodera trifolii TaxID=157864 RepID=A0ABD2HNY9_9BILA
MRFSPRIFPSFLQQLINRNFPPLHCSLPTTSAAKFSTDGKSDAFCASLLHNELCEKLSKCKEEWRKQRPGTKEYSATKEQLNQLQEEIIKIEDSKYEFSPIERDKMSISNLVLAPTQVTLEVISNGTSHLRPSVVLRTPLNAYLFNCPEGICRFLPTFRLRTNAINDMFFTKANWDNTGGIASVLLNKENTDETLRLHGPHRIKHFLEQQRPFLDVDFGHVNYPVVCEEWTFDREHFEDPILHVHYIPIIDQPKQSSSSSPASPSSPNLSPSNSPSSSPPNSPSATNATTSTQDQQGNYDRGKVDVAFLVKVKETTPSIDPIKLLKLKIPKGPHIARLKAGNPITLEDGREIQPNDVYSDAAKILHPNLLFVEIVSGEKLRRIHANPLLKDFMGDGRRDQMSYIVHFTRERLLNSGDYRVWMRSFGPNCRHLVLNGTGPPMVLNDGIYKAQQQLNAIFPEAFPQIYPPPEHYEGKDFTQNIESDDSLAQHPSTADGIGPIFIGSLLQRFPIRGQLPKYGATDPNMLRVDFTVKELDFRLEQLPELTPKLNTFRKTLDAALAARGVPDPFPQVFFLGTASAVSAKYRNVSSHLLQLSPTSAVMIDCGEGTYGQMRTLFGPEMCAKMLTHLNALFITHSHLDHTNGLFTIVQERVKAFCELGLPYRPLVFVSNFTTRKTVTKAYPHSYNNIDRFLKYVDAPFVLQEDSVGINPTAVNSVRSPGIVIELTKFFSRPLFSPKQWNLRSATAVQVLHTRASNAFVFQSEDTGRRVVFSGDTKPCKLLEEHGQNADLLIHECTFEDGMEHDAFRKRHSTMRQAFDSARRMRAKHVLFTHFSTRKMSEFVRYPKAHNHPFAIVYFPLSHYFRYSRVPLLPDYLLEAGNFGVANDYMVVPFDLRHVFPKMLPLYRVMFKEELFTSQVKMLKRRMDHQQEDTDNEHRKPQQMFRR